MTSVISIAKIVKSFKEIAGSFRWFLDIGKTDSDNIKEEIQDLLYHSSQSFKSLIELTDTLEEIPIDEFSFERYMPIVNHCYWFFTSPDGIQKARTHCTDIERDVNRINFKMAKLLRTEDQNWKGINDAFNDLMNADTTFLEQYGDELKNIGDEMQSISSILNNGNTKEAWGKYNSLRISLLEGKKSLADEISKMQNAQVHVHKLLT